MSFNIESELNRVRDEVSALQVENAKLRAEVDRLSEDSEMANGCLIMIHGRLKALGCSHNNDHDETPAMMYPEWIGCVVHYHKEAARAEERERAAKIAEEWGSEYPTDDFCCRQGPEIAEAIRASGE